MTSPPVPSRSEQLAAILTESQRPDRVPFRNDFVQKRVSRARVEPGPLSTFVQRGRESALDQYMIALAWASGGTFDVRRDSRIWARAIGASADEAGRRTVSRNWGFLSELNLVDVRRVGRLASVTLRMEDGSGREYRKPGAVSAKYFQVPFMFWTAEWVSRLSLSGKALLLIALSLPDLFILPAERGPEWYGISKSTVERGLRELHHAELLSKWGAMKPAPLAPEGYTKQNYYALRFPFGPRGRIAGNVPEAVRKASNLSELKDMPTLQSS